MSASESDVRWNAVVRFATEPDDPRLIASQLAPLVEWEEIAVRERGDLELSLHVVAANAYDAARTALDRVQSATRE